MLHAETLEPGTFLLLKRIQALPFMANTRLVGGTALALLLGHRKSVDLDFFSKKYPNTALFMAMRSLVYFSDAEETPVPEMLAPFNWDDAVATIREKVTAFAGKV